MKKILFVVVVMAFVATAAPALADDGRFYIRSEKYEFVREDAFSYQNVKDLVEKIREQKEKQRKMGDTCYIEDMPFGIIKKTGEQQLFILMICKKINPSY